MVGASSRGCRAGGRRGEGGGVAAAEGEGGARSQRRGGGWRVSPVGRQTAAGRRAGWWKQREAPRRRPVRRGGGAPPPDARLAVRGWPDRGGRPIRRRRRGRVTCHVTCVSGSAAPPSLQAGPPRGFHPARPPAGWPAGRRPFGRGTRLRVDGGLAGRRGGGGAGERGGGEGEGGRGGERRGGESTAARRQPRRPPAAPCEQVAPRVRRRPASRDGPLRACRGWGRRHLQDGTPAWPGSRGSAIEQNTKQTPVIYTPHMLLLLPPKNKKTKAQQREYHNRGTTPLPPPAPVQQKENTWGTPAVASPRPTPSSSCSSTKRGHPCRRCCRRCPPTRAPPARHRPKSCTRQCSSPTARGSCQSPPRAPRRGRPWPAAVGRPAVAAAMATAATAAYPPSRPGQVRKQWPAETQSLPPTRWTRAAATTTVPPTSPPPAPPTPCPAGAPRQGSPSPRPGKRHTPGAPPPPTAAAGRGRGGP